jgi:hypothetical protein
LILELDLGCDTKEEKKITSRALLSLARIISRTAKSLYYSDTSSDSSNQYLNFSDIYSHPIHFRCLSDMSRLTNGFGFRYVIILFKFDQWIWFSIRHDMRRYVCSAFQILLHTLPQAETTTNLRNDISVCRFIYLGHTHFDISFAVSVMSYYIHNLRNDHIDVVYQILKYLNSAHEKWLIFRKTDHVSIRSYCGSDRANCSDDRRSTSGLYLHRRQLGLFKKQEATFGGKIDSGSIVQSNSFGSY